MAEELLLMPKELVEAIVAARENKDANHECDKRLEKYLEECETRNLNPPQWWIKFLQGLANRKKIIELFDELEINPYGIGILNATEKLRLHGFPKEFLQGLNIEAEQQLAKNKCPSS